MKSHAIGKRACGVLLPVFSLPSEHGIGCFSAEARAFVDFLADAGQSYWQILPTGPTGYGDSPYQSFSTFAGNPYFIDPVTLEREGMLSRASLARDAKLWKQGSTDYAALYRSRFALLKEAYRNTSFSGARKTDYRRFVRENAFWLKDYTLFMALKDAHGGAPFTKWEEGLRLRTNKALSAARKQYADEIGFYLFLQYLFARQWSALKHYANQKGIEIIGDLPIYVAMDSSDVWANPELFELDKNRMPVRVAGCPPDDYAVTGQLWGNPLYRWDVHRKEGYAWWVKRMRHALTQSDIVRIDHFRGFESYYAIPASHDTAEHGVWKKGPGMRLFDAFEQELPGARVIAEDLGFLTPEVYRLVERCGYPGMKVLQFAFYPDEDGVFSSNYLTYRYDRNCVVYTGTHDNDTTRGWFETLNKKERAFVKSYLGLEPRDGGERVTGALIRAALSSVADTAMIPMQDYLGLDGKARINTPSTLGDNWIWRMKKTQMSAALARRMRALAETYGRV